MVFIEGLKNGLAMGSIFALMALGYSMVYGIVKMINFAHSEFITIGGFGSYVVVKNILDCTYEDNVLNPIWKLLIGLAVGIIIAVVIGILTERFAYRPLRKKGSSRITALITAIGVSYIIGGVINALYHEQVTFPTFFNHDTAFIISLTVTTVLLIALTLFVKKTKIGIAMRAVAENEEAAKLMGINNNFIISLTFVIGSALAAIGAVIYLLRAPQLKHDFGSNVIGLYPFVAAVIGGIGSLPGAVIGGFLIGLIKEFSIIYGVSSWVVTIVYGIFVVILLFKPEGLLGKNTKEKV